MIGLFVDPGVFADDQGRKNRNTAYDAYDDRYVSFLMTEVIPQVTQRYAIAENPEQWGICGGSSGGNCAFTAAWLRPDKFGKVIGYLSSFVQMSGGNPYPDAIARALRKPLRIFLQAGHRDLGWDKAERNWLASNLRVAAALAESGYDFRLVLGDGGHSPNHTDQKSLVLQSEPDQIDGFGAEQLGNSGARVLQNKRPYYRGVVWQSVPGPER